MKSSNSKIEGPRTERRVNEQKLGSLVQFVRRVFRVTV